MKSAAGSYHSVEGCDDWAQHLAPLERDLLELGARRGLSQRSVARRLGLSVHEARRRLASALRKIDQGLRTKGGSEAQPW